MRKLLLFTLKFFSGIIYLYAQPIPVSLESGKFSFDYTKTVPGIPENGNLGSYGNIPVNTAKGLPEINFTLYTLSKDNVDIPISISYIASGIKYNDIPSCVGMKWTLNAGGSINRSVNGIADEDFLLNNLFVIDSAKVLYQNDHIYTHNTQDSCIQTAKNNFDYQLDNYYYNFPGHIGSMYLGKDKQFRPDKEFSKIKIFAANHLDSFIIKDGSGNTYYFGTYTDNSAVYYTGKYSSQAKTTFAARVSWKLYRIVTASNQQINFEYTYYNYQYSTLDTESYIVYNINDGFQHSDECGLHGLDGYSTGYNGGSFQTTQFTNSATLISKIYTDDQEIYFNYFDDNNQTIFAKRLSSIKVFSKISQDTIKTFRFDNSNGYLTSFTESGRDVQTFDKKYSFEYNGQMLLPNTTSLARDMFGYNNGAVSNNSLIDNSSLHNEYYQLGIGDRSISEFYASQGTLNRIIYPTGGSTSFAYECNKGDLGTYINAPGIRLKSTWDVDINNKIYNKKNFYYRNLVGGISVSNMTLATEDQMYLDPSMLYIYFSDNPNAWWVNDFFYSTVVIENIGNEVSTERHYEKNFYDFQYGLYSNDALLIKKEIFIGDTFNLQKRYIYSYDFWPIESLSIRMYVLGKPKPTLGRFYYDGDPVEYHFCPPSDIYQPFETRYILYPKIYTLKNVSEEYFSNNGESIINSSNHYYNIDPITLNRTETTGSDGITQTMKYFYPFDFNWVPSLNSMTNSFIINPIVKEQYFVNNVLKKEKENIFEFNQYGFFTIKNQVITDIASGGSQTFNNYGYNSKAKILSKGLSNDFVTSYIWDYHYELPIAEVINSDTVSIAYTSFESDGNGHWNIGSEYRNSSQSITGNKSYYLPNGYLFKDGLTMQKKYIVSYWSTNGQYIVPGTTSVKSGKTINGWTYYEHTIAGITATSISGIGLIDEVRLYPKGAQMNTYSYLHLIGINSHCDENNHITYYEYDPLNRLQVIRDEDNNILRKVCYKYNGQPEECQ